MSSSPSPSSSNNLPPWIILLLAAIGVPPAAYFTFTQIITPWEALGLVLFYEMVIILIAIKKEFENDFAKKFVVRIRSMREYPCGYQQYYLNHLSKVYGTVEKLGMQIPSPLKIEEIFVEPTYVPESSDWVSPNPIEPPKESRPDEKPIWDYLASESLLILGAVGIGKSTLLQHIALTLVDRKKRLKFGVSYKVPFLLFLDQLSKELKRNEDLSLTGAIETAIKSGWRQPPSEWIEQRLKKGRCVILLDGLDEVADSNNRRQVIAWINKQINIFDKNRFIITSRPLGYHNNPLEKVTSLAIQGFSDEKIYEFVDKWYQATKHDSTGAGELKKQLLLSKEKSDLLKLARNPLLLRMIIVVHQFGPLPENRIDLYERIFDIYLGERPHVGERWRWKESSHTKRELLSKEEKQKILQLLAYKMMETGIREIESTDAEELIKASFRKIPITVEQFLQNAPHNGILVQLRLSYRFAHRSFQEYLAAMYAKDIQQPELLVKHINPRELSQWLETIVLYCSKAEPTPIMSACLEGYSLLEDTLDLALALYLEPEVQKNVVQWVKVKPAIHEVRKRFERAVMLATEDEDPDVRHKIAKALLAHRKQSLNPDDETPIQKSTDTSLIKCAEYQLFLDLTESHNARQPDHLIRFPAGQGLAPVLGVHRSDAIAFCDWLTEQESGDWHYRVPTSKESKNISMRNPGIGYWIKDGNEFAWAKSGPISSNSISLEQLNRSSNQDRYNEPNTPPKTEHHRFLAGLIPIVDKLRQAYDLHHDLVELLTSIHKLILDHKRKLEDESKYATNDKADLQIKFKEARAQQTALERDLRKIASQRHQLREAVEKKKNLQRQLDEIDIKELSKKLKTMQHTRLTLSNKLERYSEALSHETNVTERGIAWDQRADSERGSIYGGTVCQDSFGAKIRQNTTIREMPSSIFSDTLALVFDNQALDANAHDCRT